MCEVRFETPGNYTFTAPTGITKLAALAIGGGGSGQYGGINDSYGGAAGLTYYADITDFSAPIELVVGAGGAGAAGTSSFIGSFEATGGGAGGNGNCGGNNAVYFGTGCSGSEGGGAGSTSDANGIKGGTGMTLSEASLDLDLFPYDPTDTTYYAVGGDGSQSVEVSTVQTAGSGGASNGVTFVADDGRDGMVVLRWAPIVTPDPPTPTPPAPLPNTGQSFPTALALVGGSALAVGGLAFAAQSMKRKRRSN